MSWDTARKEAKAATSGGGAYLSLKSDGDSAKVVFVGQPLSYQKVWLQAEGRSETYDPVRHKGERPQRRFKVAVYNLDAGEMQIFDMAAGTYSNVDEAIFGIEEDEDINGGGLESVYKIVRKGTGTKTTYSVNFIKTLSEEGKAKIAQHEVPEVRVDKPAPAPSTQAADEDIPF